MGSMEHHFYRLCLKILQVAGRGPYTGLSEKSAFSDRVYVKIPDGQACILAWRDALIVTIDYFHSGDSYEVFRRDHKTHRYPVCNVSAIPMLTRIFEERFALDLLADV